MTMQTKNHLGRSPWLLPRLCLVGGTVLALGACDVDSLLDVTDPTVAAPGTIATEAAAPTTLAAAIGGFALAFSGAPGAGSFVDGQIVASGTLGDELYIPDSFPTRLDVDQRATDFQNATQQATYARLHTARRLAEQSASLHGEFAGTTNTVGHAHALSLAGFTYILFGENYCSGVPFSDVSPVGAIEFGPPLNTVQMFSRGIEFFDQAIAAATAAGAATGAADQLSLARLGKARALLNRGQGNDRAEAAALAAQVPTAFVYRIFHSEASTRQNNGVWAATNDTRRASPSDREGNNGLPYRSANDPRVPWATPATAAARLGFDGSTPFFQQLKYPARTSPVILASGVEARLIEAEHQLATGGNWLATLNAVRAAPPTAYYPAAQFPNLGNLQPLTDPGTEAGRVDLLFRERGFWMWLTSHRLGDHRRLMRQYGRTQAGAGFPTGEFFKGGQIGNHVSLLVPFDELNNPLFRDAFPNGCDPTIP